MSLLTILEVPHPSLKKTAKPVEKITDETQTLIDDMFETMYAAPGIGLAAPQVGIEQRLVVVDVGSDEKREHLAAINPRITWFSDEMTVAEEGCLSLPKQFADVKRPKAIRLDYLDRDGDARSLEADELLARCLQHEIDHLNGVLFVDHLSALKRKMILRRLAKSRRQRPD